jgi:hypothetical protein
MPTKPVLLVTDLHDGVIRAALTNNAGQTSRIKYEESGYDIVIHPISITDDGYVDISGLHTELDIYFLAQVWDGVNDGLISNIHEIQSQDSKVKNRDQRKHMSSFIKNLLVRSPKFNWYTKMVAAAGIPDSQINMPFTGEIVHSQLNENVHVADQPAIFQCRGSINVVIQRTGGFNKADLGFGNVRFGDFTAFCDIDHRVELDDRLINPIDQTEYRVVHSTPHTNGLYRHLELKWLI